MNIALLIILQAVLVIFSFFEGKWRKINSSQLFVAGVATFVAYLSSILLASLLGHEWLARIVACGISIIVCPLSYYRGVLSRELTTS